MGSGASNGAFNARSSARSAPAPVLAARLCNGFATASAEEPPPSVTRQVAQGHGSAADAERIFQSEKICHITLPSVLCVTNYVDIYYSFYKSKNIFAFLRSASAGTAPSSSGPLENCTQILGTEGSPRSSQV